MLWRLNYRAHAGAGQGQGHRPGLARQGLAEGRVVARPLQSGEAQGRKNPAHVVPRRRAGGQGEAPRGGLAEPLLDAAQSGAQGGQGPGGESCASGAGKEAGVIAGACVKALTRRDSPQVGAVADHADVIRRLASPFLPGRPRRRAPKAHRTPCARTSRGEPWPGPVRLRPPASRNSPTP